MYQIVTYINGVTFMSESFDTADEAIETSRLLQEQHPDLTFEVVS